MNRLKHMTLDSEEVWISGVPDKYLDRAVGRMFSSMCLAEFALEYRVVYGQEVGRPRAIPVQNEKGSSRREQWAN